MKTILGLRCSALIGAVLFLALPVSAVPTLVVGADTPTCDVLAVPTTVLDELGTAPPFPVGEQIATAAAPSTYTPCAGVPDNPLIANVVVSITNLNAVAFSDVWYVANYDTTLSNVDGTVLSVSAFRIDAVGVNTPLIFESILADGIFAPGETWQFVIQDYTNVPGQPASLISDIGLPSAGFGSSGSIIANPVPEPTTAVLLGLGLLGLGLARRRTV
jgi:hypothetical protein